MVFGSSEENVTVNLLCLTAKFLVTLQGVPKINMHVNPNSLLCMWYKIHT